MAVSTFSNNIVRLVGERLQVFRAENLCEKGARQLQEEENKEEFKQ